MADWDIVTEVCNDLGLTYNVSQGVHPGEFVLAIDDREISPETLNRYLRAYYRKQENPVMLDTSSELAYLNYATDGNWVLDFIECSHCGKVYTGLDCDQVHPAAFGNFCEECLHTTEGQEAYISDLIASPNPECCILFPEELTALGFVPVGQCLSDDIDGVLEFIKDLQLSAASNLECVFIENEDNFAYRDVFVRNATPENLQEIANKIS